MVAITEGLSLSEIGVLDTVVSVVLSSLLCDAKVKVRSLSGIEVVEDREVVVLLSLSGIFAESVGLSLSLSLSGVEVEEDEDSLSVNGRVPYVLVTTLEMDETLTETLSLSSETRKCQSGLWRNRG